MVHIEDGEVKAKSYEAQFCEVSARSGDNVQTLFKLIASTLPGSENSQMLSMSGRTQTQPHSLLGPTPQPSKLYLILHQLTFVKHRYSVKPKSSEGRRRSYKK